MSIFLGVSIALFNFILLCKNRDKGIILYCILLAVCPVSIIGSTSLVYSYVSLPFLIFWYFLYKGYEVKQFDVLFLLILIYILTIFATVYSSSLGIASEINYISFVGSLKYILIFLVLSRQNVLRERFVIILGAIIIINVCALTLEFMLIQIWSPSQVVELWLRLYGTIGTSGSLNAVMEFGQVGRLHGTFASSAFPGTLSMLGIGVYLMRYFKYRDWTSILMLVASLYCGLCSASKRFFLGAVAMVLVCLFLKIMWIKATKLDLKLPLIIVLFVFITISLYSVLGEYLNLDYYLQYLLEGNFGGSLDTRFGEKGVVNSMRPYIEEYGITGLGDIHIRSVLITDSQFYVSIFKSGYLGLMLHFFIFIRLSSKIYKKKEVIAMVVLFDVIFEFFISTEFYSQLGLLFLAYVSSVSLKRKMLIL